VQDKEELLSLSLCKEHGLNSSSMRHLVGIFASNSRPAHVKGWRLLDTVRWFRPETDGPSVPGFCARMRFESAPAKKWEKFNSGSLHSNGVGIARLDGWSVVALPAMPWATC
jgi:hypothetical protein